VSELLRFIQSNVAALPKNQKWDALSRESNIRTTPLSHTGYPSFDTGTSSQPKLHNANRCYVSVTAVPFALTTGSRIPQVPRLHRPEGLL
jgi:hypothetical protein